MSHNIFINDTVTSKNCVQCAYIYLLVTAESTAVLGHTKEFSILQLSVTFICDYQMFPLAGKQTVSISISVYMYENIFTK